MSFAGFYFNKGKLIGFADSKTSIGNQEDTTRGHIKKIFDHPQAMIIAVGNNLIKKGAEDLKIENVITDFINSGEDIDKICNYLTTFMTDKGNDGRIFEIVYALKGKTKARFCHFQIDTSGFKILKNIITEDYAWITVGSDWYVATNFLDKLAVLATDTLKDITDKILSKVVELIQEKDKILEYNPVGGEVNALRYERI